jgi:hypothetical protein
MREAAASEAQNLADRAKQALERAQEALKAETTAADQKIAEARKAESEVVQAAAAENACAATLSTLESKVLTQPFPYGAGHPATAYGGYGGYAGYGHGAFPGAMALPYSPR